MKIKPTEKKEIQEAQKLAETSSRTLVTYEDYQPYVDLLVAIKVRLNKLKAIEERFLAPVRQLREEVKAVFGNTVTELETMEGTMKTSIAKFEIAVIDAENRKNIEAGNTDPNAMLTYANGIGRRKSLNFKVIDQTKVPEKFKSLQIDEAKVKEFLKVTGGVVPIEGIEVSENRVISVLGANNDK